MEKTELYKAVRETVGSKAVMLKAVEEISELIAVLSSTSVAIMHGDLDLVALNKTSILGEMADVMITLEQVTGERQAMESVEFIFEAKMQRLEEYLKNGNLLKGLL